MMWGFCAKHDPGAKTDEEMAAMAEWHVRAFAGGSTEQLNAQLKSEYGESFDEYVASTVGVPVAAGAGAGPDASPCDKKKG